MNLNLPTPPISDEDARACERPIGGFFELEIPPARGPVHFNAIALSNGRACLLAILNFLKPTRCYVPDYTCDATLQPFYQLGIEVRFYQLDSALQPINPPTLESDECFLLTNYFGLQRELCVSFSRRYASRLIIDDTHDFFSFGNNPQSWSFTSARKYFGVPDGAFLYVVEGIEQETVVPDSTPAFGEISLQHGLHRLQGKQEQAFQEYQNYERNLPCSISRISEYSRSLLSMLDLDEMHARRRKNFNFLATKLAKINTLPIAYKQETSPFVYPLLPAQPLPHQRFHQRQIFVPIFWPDVLSRATPASELAMHLTQNLIPFPVDHRYGEREMQRIVDVTMDLREQR